MKKRYIGFLSALCLSAAVLLSGCGKQGLTTETVAADPLGYVKTGGAVISEAWRTDDSVLLPLLGSLAEAGEGQIAFTAEPGGGALEGVLAFDAEMVFAEANGTVLLSDDEEEDAPKKGRSEKQVITKEAAAEAADKEDDGEAAEKLSKKKPLDVDLLTWLDEADFVLQSGLLLGTKDAHGFAWDRLFAQGAESGLAKAIGLTEAHTAVLSALPESEASWPVLLQTALQKMETAEAEFWALFEGMEAVVSEETVTIDDEELEAIAVTTPMPEALAEEMGTDGDCVFYLNKENGALMRVDFGCGSETAEQVSLLFGADPTEVTKLALEVCVERDEEETLTFTAELKKSRSDKTDRYDVNFYLARNDGDPVNFGVLLFHNTGTDAYMLQLTSTEGDRTQYFFELRGNVFFRKDGADVTVHTMKINDVAVECAIEAELTCETDLPDKPAYRDLLHADAAVLETLGGFVSLNWIDELASAIRLRFEEEIQGHCFKCYKDAVKKVFYLGEDWLCCKACARDIARVQDGNYCDSCWNETDAAELATADVYGVEYRLCPDCYEYMTSY